MSNERFEKIFKSDGQKTGELALAVDWNHHPLGPPSGWPRALIVSLGIIFNSKHPMCLFWGEKSYFFFNDGYLPIVGQEKVNWAMGEETSKVWAEAWDEYVKPNIERSRLEGKASWFVDHFIPILHEGKLRDAYFTYSNSPIFNDEGVAVGALTVCTETTEAVANRKLLIEEKLNLEVERKKLVTSVGLLEQEKSLRERFVAAVSHDLRTPLTAAKMSSELLSLKLSQDPVLCKTAKRITKNMDRADGMIRDILDASSVNAGEKFPLKIQPCRLNKILSDVIEDLQEIHGDRFVTLSEEHIEGFWDIDGMKRIIENLVSNAIKYGKAGSEITVRSSGSEKTICLSVHNTGDAIPENELPFLFDQYKRAKTARLSGQKGWGIGLTLVKAITEAHGGRVTVASDAVSGTTFFVEVPRDSRKF